MFPLNLNCETTGPVRLPPYAGALFRLRAFETNPAHGAMASSYGLRMLWRVLMRRYAFWHAWSVGKKLRTYERLGLWLIIRRSSYLMPRLMVAVLAGFLLLSSSSTLMDILFRTSDKPWRAGVTTIALIVVYLLAAAEVQRRIGRVGMLGLTGRKEGAESEAIETEEDGLRSDLDATTVGKRALVRSVAFNL